MKILTAVAFGLVSITSLAASKPMQPPGWFARHLHIVGQDYSHLYSQKGLWKMGGGLALTAVLANTEVDQDIANYYQGHLRRGTTNRWAATFKHFGNNNFLAAYVGAMMLGPIVNKLGGGQGVSEWGARCARAFIVGGPTVYALQYLTGSYRPNENKNSHWHPFAQSHGVSGHAFLGSIPFITAAQMVHQPVVKGVLYGLSTLTGLSRINDNMHYFSQVMMGWWMGYLAVSAVSDTESAKAVQITPVAVPGGGAVVLSKSI